MTDQRLVELALAAIVQGHGMATSAQLHARGLSTAKLTCLLSEHVLLETGEDQYFLAEPLVDIDPLVLIHWAIPEGIFGGLTTLVYRYLSVARLVAFDVFVPEWVAVPTEIANTPLYHHVLPPALLDFGVESFSPSLPGTVAVPMFTPAVALAQVLADAMVTAETRQDAILEYLAAFDHDHALTDALSRYEIAPSTVDMLVANAAR